MKAKKQLKQLSLVLFTTFSMGLTACAPGLLTGEVSDPESLDLLGSSRKLMDDVDAVVEAGDESLQKEAGIKPPHVVCGTQNTGVQLPEDAKEREVLLLLTRQQALSRMLELLARTEERLKDQNLKAPDQAELKKQLEELAAKIESLESDEAYKAAFEKGRERLEDMAKNPPGSNLTDEQRACLKTETLRFVCEDLSRVVAEVDAGTNQREIPAENVERLRKILETKCKF